MKCFIDDDECSKTNTEMVRGLCNAHYRRWIRGNLIVDQLGDPLVRRKYEDEGVLGVMARRKVTQADIAEVLKTTPADDMDRVLNNITRTGR